MKKKEKRFCSSIFESLKEDKIKEKIRKNRKQNGYDDKVKGFETEELCMLAFLKKGLKVFRPVFENCPYDLIVEMDNNLYKIQVKSSHWLDEKDQIFGFNSKKAGYKKDYTPKTIDYFMTSFEGKEYLIPFEETKNRINKLSLNKESSVYAGKYLFE